MSAASASRILVVPMKASSGEFGHAPIVHLGATRDIDKDPPRHASLREPEQPRREEEKGGPARGRGGVCGAGKFQPRTIYRDGTRWARNRGRGAQNRRKLGKMR